MATDLRTEKQKQRDALHQTIVAEFYALRKQAPTASNHRRMCAIAEKHQMTSAGVRRILVDNRAI